MRVLSIILVMVLVSAFLIVPVSAENYYPSDTVGSDRMPFGWVDTTLVPVTFSHTSFMFYSLQYQKYFYFSGSFYLDFHYLSSGLFTRISLLGDTDLTVRVYDCDGRAVRTTNGQSFDYYNVGVKGQNIDGSYTKDFYYSIVDGSVYINGNLLQGYNIALYYREDYKKPVRFIPHNNWQNVLYSQYFGYSAVPSAYFYLTNYENLKNVRGFPLDIVNKYRTHFGYEPLEINSELNESIGNIDNEIGNFDNTFDDYTNSSDSFFNDLDSYSSSVDPANLTIPHSLLNTMSFISGYFMKFFNKTGDLNIIIMFPMFLGLFLLLIGRGAHALNTNTIKRGKSSIKKGDDG